MLCTSETAERLRVDAFLCRAFGKRPGESLNEAAHRMVGNHEASTRERWAARTLLSTGRAPWDAMFSAARILRGSSSR